MHTYNNYRPYYLTLKGKLIVASVVRVHKCSDSSFAITAVALISEREEVIKKAPGGGVSVATARLIAAVFAYLLDRDDPLRTVVYRKCHAHICVRRLDLVVLRW